MVNKGTGDIQIVGRTCEQIIRDALNKYGLPELEPDVYKPVTTMSATGTLISEDIAQFFDMMIQSERDYPYGVPEWMQGI